VLQVLQGFSEEARWLRHADGHLRHLFPYLPGQSGYNKRLRKSAGVLQALIRILGRDTDVWADDTWLIDSTPVETARSRPTVKRSNLAGWAGYGYCASHSRFFHGLRLHLVCTPTGLPVTFANPKADERDIAIDMFDHDPSLFHGRDGQTVIADKGYASREFEPRLALHGIELVRPTTMAAIRIVNATAAITAKTCPQGLGRPPTKRSSMRMVRRATSMSSSEETTARCVPASAGA